MGRKFLPDSLGIHIIKEFPHNGLAHVTDKHLLKTLYIKSFFNLNNSKLSASLLGL